MNQMDYDAERAQAAAGAVAPPAATPAPDTALSKENWLKGKSSNSPSFWAVCKANPLVATVALGVLACMVLAFVWAWWPSAVPVATAPALTIEEVAKPAVYGQLAAGPSFIAQRRNNVKPVPEHTFEPQVETAKVPAEATTLTAAEQQFEDRVDHLLNNLKEN